MTNKIWIKDPVVSEGELRRRRLLYTRVTGLDVNWNAQVSVLEAFVRDNPQLSSSKDFYYFYFFASPKDENFDYEDAWFGQEVVGHVLLEEDEEFGLYDMESSKVIFLDWRPTPSELLSFTPRFLKSEVSKCALRFEAQGKNLAQTWALGFRMGEDPHVQAIFFIP